MFLSCILTSACLKADIDKIRKKNSNHICDVHIKLFHDNNLLMYNREIRLTGLNFLRLCNKLIQPFHSLWQVCEIFSGNFSVWCFQLFLLCAKKNPHSTLLRKETTLKIVKFKVIFYVCSTHNSCSVVFRLR